LNQTELTESLKRISEKEYQRFRRFHHTHSKKSLHISGNDVFYYSCGCGKPAILTFAGGWGPPEIIYDMILSLEEKNKIIVIDVSPFDDPEDLCRGINRVLESENTERVLLSGQSMSGIVAQTYLKRNAERVTGLILTNTIAPRKERCKKWALALFKAMPQPFLRAATRIKLKSLGEFEKEVSNEVKERRRFAAALMRHIMDQYFTKKNTLNMLKLAYSFNEKDTYSEDDFTTWQGRALIVTSKDDPYHSDVYILMQSIPNAELFTFPSGFKHTAPQIFREEFYALIQQFADKLR